jgi:cell division protein FtsB
MRWVTVLLGVLLAAVWAELLFGKGGVAYVSALQKQLAAQQRLIGQAQQRNSRLVAEVADLKNGEEIVEEKARLELGMVKPREILVQFTQPRQ